MRKVIFIILCLFLGINPYAQYKRQDYVDLAMEAIKNNDAKGAMENYRKALDCTQKGLFDKIHDTEIILCDLLAASYMTGYVYGFERGNVYGKKEQTPLQINRDYNLASHYSKLLFGYIKGKKRIQNRHSTVLYE